MLIVDESPEAVARLRELIESSPDFVVVGSTSQPEKVLDKVLRLQPDVITLDFQVPRLRGAEATRLIMQERPTPILIVTSQDAAGRDLSQFNLLEAGAVDLISKDGLLDAQRSDSACRAFLRKLKIVAGVPVLRRSSYMARVAAEAAPLAEVASPPPRLGAARPPGYRLLAVGASTGGPPALLTLLGSLPQPFPLPIVLVQHMGDDFIDGFVAWLRTSIRAQVVKADGGERPAPGVVYVAPGNAHLVVTKGGALALDPGPPLHSCRPSIDRLFFSIAEHHPAEGIGVLLTGMGRDGAQGLKAMRTAGGLTIIQDEASSVVFGMPGEAFKLRAHSLVLPIQEMGGVITTHVRRVAS